MPNMETARMDLTRGMPWRFETRGKVTWSSMIWGLRPIHSVKTMTWFSERSGRASTGVFFMAMKPQTERASAAMSTRIRFRMEHEMMDSTMCPSSYPIAIKVLMIRDAMQTRSMEKIPGGCLRRRGSAKAIRCPCRDEGNKSRGYGIQVDRVSAQATACP
jgi:hypothetical protein